MFHTKVVNALNDDRVLQAVERNHITFCRPDSHLIQIWLMLFSSSVPRARHRPAGGH